MSYLDACIINVSMIASAENRMKFPKNCENSMETIPRLKKSLRVCAGVLKVSSTCLSGYAYLKPAPLHDEVSILWLHAKSYRAPGKLSVTVGRLAKEELSIYKSVHVWFNEFME